MFDPSKARGADSHPRADIGPASATGRCSPAQSAIFSNLAAEPESIADILAEFQKRLPAHLADSRDPLTGSFTAGKMASASLGTDIAMLVVDSISRTSGKPEVKFIFSDIQHAGVLNEAGLGATLDRYLRERVALQRSIADANQVGLIQIRPGGDEFAAVVVGSANDISRFMIDFERRDEALRQEILGSDPHYAKAVEAANVRQTIRELKRAARATIQNGGQSYQPKTVLAWAEKKMSEDLKTKFAAFCGKLSPTNDTTSLRAAAALRLLASESPVRNAVPGRASTGYADVAAGAYRDPRHTMLNFGIAAYVAQNKKEGETAAPRAGFRMKERDGLLVDRQEQAEKRYAQQVRRLKTNPAPETLLESAHLALRDANLSVDAFRGDLALDAPLEILMGRSLQPGSRITVVLIDTQHLGAIQSEGGRYDIGDRIVSGHVPELRALNVPGPTGRTKGGEAVLITLHPKDQIPLDISAQVRARDEAVQALLNASPVHRDIMEVDLVTRAACRMVLTAAGDIDCGQLPALELGKTIMEARTFMLPEQPTLRKLMAAFGAATPG